MSFIWTMLGICALLEFFCAVTLIALAFRFRRSRALAFSVLLLSLSYIVLQCACSRCLQTDLSPGRAAFVDVFTAGRGLVPAALCGIMAAGIGLVWRDLSRRAFLRITPSSIKDALDTLPSGVCFYREDGRMLLVNRTMENLCRRLTGEALVNGRTFFEQLHAETLPEGCQRAAAGEEPVIVLPDGAAWSFSRKQVKDQKFTSEMLVASDVTELYEKTRALNEAREKVTALNRRLTEFNREIVDLTAAREILNAKVKIHDELGGNLLSIRRYLLEGGSPKDLGEIAERLRGNIAFLKSGQTEARRDEYALMLETAKALGVTVQVTGSMPEWENARHILTVAIHECFTNTLRHAHGSALFVDIHETERRVTAEFRCDGEQPKGPIRERGGLRSLRELTEGAGGRMDVRTTPDFCITIEVPKEDEDGLPGYDRGRSDDAAPAV